MSDRWALGGRGLSRECGGNWHDEENGDISHRDGMETDDQPLYIGFVDDFKNEPTLLILGDGGGLL